MDAASDSEIQPDPPAVTVESLDDTESDDLLRRAALWDTAFRDRDEFAAADLLAPDFTQELVHPVRNVMTRSVWLEVLPDYVIHEWDVEDRIVDVDGDFGAILQRVRMRATVMGEDRSGVLVLSDLWRRVGDEWRVWRRHSTPLLAAHPRDHADQD
jgi:hypothetical protein